MITTKKYDLDQVVVNTQINLLMEFAQSYAYYQAIHQYHNSPIFIRNYSFWIHTMNTHYLKAIIDWCIVFGVDSNEPHWKKVSTNMKAEISVELPQKFCNAAHFTRTEWDSYWNTVTDFRNDYAAHKNLKIDSQNAPHLEKSSFNCRFLC